MNIKLLYTGRIRKHETKVNIYIYREDQKIWKTKVNIYKEDKNETKICKYREDCELKLLQTSSGLLALLQLK